MSKILLLELQTNHLNINLITYLIMHDKQNDKKIKSLFDS